MIKMNNHMHRSKVNFKKVVRIDATDITDSAQGLSGQRLLPMLEGEVDYCDLGVDVVEGVEAVVRLLMALHDDGVALIVDGGPSDHLLAYFRGGKHHDANAT
jgi:hypothetical protein